MSTLSISLAERNITKTKKTRQATVFLQVFFLQFLLLVLVCHRISIEYICVELRLIRYG